MYGVSEEDMVHYRDVFVDTGNAGAQVSQQCHFSTEVLCVLLRVYVYFQRRGA